MTTVTELEKAQIFGQKTPISRSNRKFGIKQFALSIFSIHVMYYYRTKSVLESADNYD